MVKYLITGITGTMGQAVTNLILSKIPNAYVLGISRDEQKQRLIKKHPRLELKLADIRSKDSLARCLSRETIIDCIIHLAALKCVDTLEDNVNEAIATNVTGTQNIVDLADDLGSDLVMASTDKACYPINAYGMSKGIAEKIVISSEYKVARYGNVLGSRGSFLPTIIDCLKAGKTIPITHKQMTRFWIKTQDVAAFLLDVLNYPRGGQVYIPDSIFSCHVTLLVQAIAEILKIEKYSLKEIGVRPGEKIHETLTVAEEGELRTSELSLIRYTDLLNYLRGVV